MPLQSGLTRTRVPPYILCGPDLKVLHSVVSQKVKGLNFHTTGSFPLLVLFRENVASVLKEFIGEAGSTFVPHTRATETWMEDEALREEGRDSWTFIPTPTLHSCANQAIKKQQNAHIYMSRGFRVKARLSLFNSFSSISLWRSTIQPLRGVVQSSSIRGLELRYPLIRLLWMELRAQSQQDFHGTWLRTCRL